MRHRQLKKWDTATWNMQTQPTLSTRTHWESRHLLWGDVAHSGMGLHLAWLLDRRKQPQIWGKEWKGKHVYINTCFNILKHHSSEEYICPYISLRLFVCWLTWLLTEQHTYEWSKKNICPPLCWLPLVTPLIFPHILYSLAITFTYFWTPYISFPPYDDKGAASTCKPAEKQNKPEAPVWLPNFWACKAQKTWFEPMISSKEIKIQQTWFFQCFIKKYQWKSKRSRDLN